MSEIYPLLDFLEFVILLPALVPVDLLAHHSVYPIIDRNLSQTFTLFTALLHIVRFCAFLCRFYAILLRSYALPPPGVFNLHFLTSTFTVAYCHSFPISSTVGFAFFLSLYVTLFMRFVGGELHAMW